MVPIINTPVIFQRAPIMNRYFIDPKKHGINLGCGIKLIKGFDNIDYISNGKNVTAMDLFKPKWNLPANHYKYIHSSHFFEHIPHRNNSTKDIFYTVMDNIFRIAEDKAILIITVPYPHLWVLEVEQHCRLVSERTFNHYTNISKYSNDKPEGQSLTLLQKYILRDLHLWKLTDYHFRKYLKLNIGRKKDLTLVFQINK